VFELCNALAVVDAFPMRVLRMKSEGCGGYCLAGWVKIDGFGFFGL